MSDALAAAKRAGHNAGHHVLDRIDALEPASGEQHWDAVAETALWPSDDLPMAGLCVVEAGLPVEIRSTMVVHTARQRRGRFKLREGQHEALVERSGVYLFVVCVPRPSKDPLAMKIVPARSVGGLVDANASWREELDGRGRKAQLTWTNVFDAAEVE
ncbi:hypothetical protein C463_06542 [Halorubrum californiense DSM 19288]|uniref:Uncharacterized protein n=1 Tax=Halorubrum californiense DSM 19288 TaxID=1227465 RepID=M0EDW9_9EURY|nr:MULTISPECIES: hypothetical protein [Halorubrum]ELZ45258.1 hypothetical protein C463_06542 [Halorubrum californiense DSM 19288]TKX72114.1 hypothetical protein EXE40_05500 [Halorubrum sp. GN11GM_10-3_MGM]